MTRWEYPGQLFVYSTETGTYVGRQVPSAAQSADGMCGAFEVRTANGQNSAYFNGALVYQAMMQYGAYESAPEVYNRGEKEYDKLMQRLELQRLPDVRFG